MMCHNTGLEYTELRKITDYAEIRAWIREEALYMVGMGEREGGE